MITDPNDPDVELINRYRWPRTFGNSTDFWGSVQLYVGIEEFMRILDRKLYFPVERCAERIAAGETPPRDVIALHLRYSDPLPDSVRRYAADLLDGTVKVKRGPQKRDADAMIRDLFQAVCKARVQRLRDRLKRRGVLHAYVVAKEHVAEKTGIPVDTLDAWVYPRRRRT